jgi:hypothetical protein
MNTILFAVAVIGLPMAPPDPFAPLLAELGDFAPLVIAGLSAVVVIALSVVLIKWGVPQLIGFFKKTAK